jgi:Ni,Fe-hydrogenase III small subunit
MVRAAAIPRSEIIVVKTRLSPNGSILLAGTGGTLVTNAGTWTFGTVATGGYVILLNGSPAAGASATELVIANGNVYAESAQGRWSEWNGSGWTSSAAPTPKTTSTTLTLAENAGTTAIGITAPTDPNYSASKLTVKVTSLPTDGTVTLSNGTAVTAGETLTVAQLTGLMFKPTAGVFGRSSTFSYTVTDPSGLNTTGSAALAIGPDTVAPKTTSTTLTVGENSAATSIGIVAPTDPNYSASQLMVKVTGLPTDGTVTLSSGTAVTTGETLTVAQLTGLMFRPTAGVFGRSSTFSYTVTNPSGLSATGSETLAIGPNTTPPVTIDPTLTVAENSGATAIGIPTPTDPNFAASQLTVKVTGLPTDGAMLLSDGVTMVTAGETLSVAQLTGLMFKPTAGVFGQNSTFTYTVTNPSGLSTAGSETLAIGPDTVAPTVSSASLTVAENSAATAIGIATPTDPNYSASQLAVKVTGLPTDGTVTLSNGTAVTAGATLTVAQLTGLMFKPSTGVYGQTSTFSYTVTNPSGLSTTGSETLAIGPQTVGTGTSSNGATLLPGSSGSLVTSDGTWSFGAALPGTNSVILLNGQVAGGGAAAELLVEGGHLFANANIATGEWYEWLNGGWTSTSAPTATGSPTPTPAPPVTIDPTLTVVPNSGATPIGIPAPSDPNYSAAQLSAKVTGLPTDGTVTLSNGTAVTLGETLSVAQLIGLMFKPAAGVFGQSSTFTYTVTNPSGLSATGVETLAIGPDTTPPVTIDPTLTVAGNSAATTIGIPAPTDPNYLASQLTVKVTGLPNDGAVLLSDGVTSVSAGETLSVTQLTGLTFKPAAGAFDQSSIFSYTVTNPSGLSTTGSETLTIGPDAVVPTTVAASLTVAENSAATAIGIAAPADLNYSASQLAVTVTGLPNDGSVLLSDGVTAVTAGETLTVAQLTGLMFTPTAGAFGQNSTFTYTVTDPSGLSTGGSATLAIGPQTVGTGTSSNGATLLPGSSGSLVTGDGTWSFGAALPGTNSVVLLNGQVAGGGAAAELLVEGGHLFANANIATGEWYEWLNGGWIPTSSPTATSVPTSPSAALTTPGSLTTVATSLTVAENSAATAIGIAAPTDPNYSASQLAVKVTGLPSDGSVLLSVGVTAVTAGETLTVAQLTGLMFTPTAGAAAESSSFTYTVSDPAGLSTAGSATLAIGPAAGPPVTIDPTLTVVPNSSATPIGIPEPSDPNYSASQLTVKVASLPNDGSVLLSDGVTAVTSGETLSVAQLTSLMFKPTSGAAAESSTFTYTVTNPSGLSASGSETLAIASSPSSPPPPAGSNVVSFALQNPTTTALSAHEVTFNEVFALGQVPHGSQLVAVINGISYAIQLDVKTSYADGSVESGLITLDAPAIAAGATLQAQLQLSSGAPGTPLDISALPGSGYNFVVSLTMHNSDGTTTPFQLNAGTLLAQALQAGKASYWMQGPQATEIQFDVPVSGSFHVTFDITDFADGTTATNVQFNNDYTMRATGGPVTYDQTITQNGTVMSQQSNITQYQYQDRNLQFWSNGSPTVNIQHDIAALEATGAIQAYDLSYPATVISSALASEAAQMASSTWGGVLPVNGVLQYMQQTGGRPDIGPTTGGDALWLITQNETAAQYALGQASAAGSVPWSFFDPTTGAVASVFQYPSLWTDQRAIGQSGELALTQQIDPINTGWTYDPAHQPDLSYVAYMLTGNLNYLGQLNAQADASILEDPGSPYTWGRAQGGYNDIVANGNDQVRQQAWSLREVDEAAYANPDGSAAKAYFTQVENDNFNFLVSQLPAWTSQEGQAYGYIPGAYAPGVMGPWMQDYFASTAIEAAEMGNQNAVKVLEWESNFLVGRFLNGANGFNPYDGVTYNLVVGNGTTDYQTWAQIEAATQAAGDSDGNGWGNSNYPQYALQSLAGIITVDSLYPTAAPITSLGAAMQAYDWLLASAPNLYSEPQFDIAPRLPDGNFLYSNQIEIDTSSNNVTLSAIPGVDTLLHAGGGTDTLTGGTGLVDLLYGGTGNDTLIAGKGNDFLFGGTATNTFVDGTGNDYMQGAGNANTYAFDESHSGHDVIANFNLTTDMLRIGPNLNSGGLTTVSSLIATATVSNGNTVLHLSPQDDITLFGISNPATLVHSILVQ